MFTNQLLKQISALCTIITSMCFILVSLVFGDQLNSQNPVLAEVEGTTIQLQIIEDKKINDLRKQLYQLVQIKLMKETISRLSAKYPKYKLGNEIEVTNKEIKAFYEMNNLAAQGTLKELSLEIKYYIKRLKEQQQLGVISQLYQMAIKEKLVTEKTVAPNDFLINVPVETAFFRNQSKNDIMILEYSDYQCPACRMTQPTVTKLLSKYNSNVIFAYRHMPLSFHTEADEAAMAVECARDQGKFEILHQALFKNQAQLAKEKGQIFNFLKTFGKSVGIEDTTKYNACIDDRKYYDRVQNDIQRAVSIGATGTPTFIIGKYDRKTNILKGEMVTGGLKMGAFENIINKYLQL